MDINALLWSLVDQIWTSVDPPSSSQDKIACDFDSISISDDFNSPKKKGIGNQRQLVMPNVRELR